MKFQPQDEVICIESPWVDSFCPQVGDTATVVLYSEQNYGYMYLDKFSKTDGSNSMMYHEDYFELIAGLERVEKDLTGFVRLTTKKDENT